VGDNAQPAPQICRAQVIKQPLDSSRKVSERWRVNTKDNDTSGLGRWIQQAIGKIRVVSQQDSFLSNSSFENRRVAATFWCVQNLKTKILQHRRQAGVNVFVKQAPSLW